MSEIVQSRVVDALDAVWSSVADLLDGLDDAEWAMPTPLPGWNVQDTVAHMVGAEAMLLGEPGPDVTIDRDVHTHVTNDIGEFNEVWIEHFRSSSPADVLEGFRSRTERRLEALRSTTPEEWTAESFTPAGPGTYGRFMQIRVFDCWLHEQDLRDALGRPGHETGVAVDVTLDELETALGFVVGKRAGAPDGTSVRFELTDGGAVVRSMTVVVDGRAKVERDWSGEPTVTLRMPVGVMTRRCAGRVSAESVQDRIDVRGDAELADRVLESLPYTI